MDHDLIVVGGGAAGLAAVRTGLWAGADVALVTDGPIGGDCTFTGCIPSKTLIAAAASGLGFDEAMARVRSTVDQVAATESAEVWRRQGVTVLEGRARLVTHDTVTVDGQRVTAPRIVVATGSRPLIPPIQGLAGADEPISGTGLADPGGTVGADGLTIPDSGGPGVGVDLVDSDGLPVGAEPADSGGLPVAGGLASGAVLTTDTLFELESRPASIGIVGGGPTGCELAQALARLGVEVTLFESDDRVLPTEEAEASEIVAAALAADGVEVQTSAPVIAVGLGAQPSALAADGVGVQSSAPVIGVSAENGAGVEAATGAEKWSATGGEGQPPAEEADRVTVRVGSQAVTVERVLLAVGRAPAVDDLGLKELGVKLRGPGWVVTDDRLATSVKGVYAAGDITGRAALTHAADETGRLAAANALGRGPRGRFRERLIPRVTFTDPEVARVGAVEAEAPARARVAYLPLSEVDRAVIDGRTDGFVKLVAGPRPVFGRFGGGRVVGATIVAPRAGEMIAEMVLAMRTGAFAGRLAQTAHAYPTWSHGVQKAAAQFFGEIEGRRARPPVSRR